MELSTFSHYEWWIRQQLMCAMKLTSGPSTNWEPVWFDLAKGVLKHLVFKLQWFIEKHLSRWLLAGSRSSSQKRRFHYPDSSERQCPSVRILNMPPGAVSSTLGCSAVGCTLFGVIGQHLDDQNCENKALYSTKLGFFFNSLNLCDQECIIFFWFKVHRFSAQKVLGP